MVAIASGGTVVMCLLLCSVRYRFDVFDAASGGTVLTLCRSMFGLVILNSVGHKLGLDIDAGGNLLFSHGAGS